MYSRLLGRIGGSTRSTISQQVRSLSHNVRSGSSDAAQSSSAAKGVMGALLVGTALYLGLYELPKASWGEVMQVLADEDAAHPPHYPWNHKKVSGAYDAASVRRGYQVYREVCSACHGMSEIAFRNLDIAFTDKEIKVLAAEVDVQDGPDDKGKMFTRPGKAFDYMKGPYANEQEARSMNGGALPPDLSVIVKARPHGEDYIFSLLTGYDEPPAGVNLREGLYFNAYFPGGAIGMAPPISDGAVEYADGTPATLSQMAKDVSTYLTYTAMPEQDKRKKDGLKVIVAIIAMCVPYYYYKRFRFALLKNRRVQFKD